MKSGGWFEEVDQLRNQFETFFASEIFERSEFSFKGDFAIARLEHDAAIVARLDPAMCAQRNGKIYSGGARMKKIQGPDIDGAAGKIDASRCGRFNKHSVFRSEFSLTIGLFMDCQ